MTPLLAIILASLVTLSGDFHTGLNELEKGNADKAVTSLTKVVEAKEDLPELKELALLGRAQAYLKQKKKDLALADIKAVVRGTKNATRRKSAIAAYKKAGGNPADLLPKKSPKATLNLMAAALEAEDFKTAKKYIAGDIRALLNTVDKVYMAEEGGSILEEIASEIDEMIVLSVEIDTNTATATAELEWDALLTVGLTMSDDIWQLTDLRAWATERHRHGGGRRTAQNRDMNTLSQLGKALKMYSMDNNELFPAKLSELTDYTSGAMLTWVDPKTGKEKDWLYKAGLTEASASSLMQIAAPVTLNGSRLVLYLDGSVAFVSEAEFLKAATKEKWTIPDLLKKADIDKDVAKFVEALITQLGDKDSKVRAAANKKLRVIGAKAIPFLREHTKHKDPEIRQTVKELLAQ